MKKQYGGVDLLGLQLKKGRPPSLSAIYVPQTNAAAAVEFAGDLPLPITLDVEGMLEIACEYCVRH